MEVKTKYDPEQMVFLKHDPEQRHWMIVSILVISFRVIKYNLVCGTEEWEAHQSELSTEINQALKLDFKKKKDDDE